MRREMTTLVAPTPRSAQSSLYQRERERERYFQMMDVCVSSPAGDRNASGTRGGTCGVLHSGGMVVCTGDVAGGYSPMSEM